MNDAPASFALTAAANASGGNTVYTGTVPSGIPANSTITIGGFSNAANNGSFTLRALTPGSGGTVTLVNAAGMAETHSATAYYPASAVDDMSANNGTYQGPVVLNTLPGIAGDTVGSGKAAEFGGDTLYTYYQVCNDWSGGQTDVSPASYVVNFSTLSASSYNVIVPIGQVGCRSYDILKDDTSHSIATAFVAMQFPINDTGPANWPSSTYTAASRNSTGDLKVASGSLILPAQSANQVFASPSSGSGVPGWRAIVGTDLPAPTVSTLGGVQSIVASSHNWISSIDTSGVPHQSQPAFTDVSGSVTPTQLPTPAASALGGVKSIAQTTNNWVQYIDTTGTPQLAQPAIGNLSGSLALGQTPLTTAGDILFANSTPALAKLPIGGTNQFLGISGGLPAWVQPSFSNLSGTVSTGQLPTVPVANGGTGQTSFSPDYSGPVVPRSAQRNCRVTAQRPAPTPSLASKPLGLPSLLLQRPIPRMPPILLPASSPPRVSPPPRSTPSVTMQM